MAEVMTRAEREELLERFGQPESLSLDERAALLRVLGERDRLHPRDCVAFRYPSMEAGHAFGRANERRCGLRVIGPTVVEGRIVDVIDLRPAYPPGAKPTDPALPDDWAGYATTADARTGVDRG